jgi:hypothetical protein
VQWRQPPLGVTDRIDAARRNAKQRNRTREPALQDKVGGVMPAGLFF